MKAFQTRRDPSPILYLVSWGDDGDDKMKKDKMFWRASQEDR